MIRASPVNSAGIVVVEELEFGTPFVDDVTVAVAILSEVVPE
jgi:hypothetical protein